MEGQKGIQRCVTIGSLNELLLLPTSEMIEISCNAVAYVIAWGFVFVECCCEVTIRIRNIECLRNIALQPYL